MSDEPREDGTETVGEIYIRTLIDRAGKMAHAHKINGLNDMEVIGLLLTVAAIRLFKHVVQNLQGGED